MQTLFFTKINSLAKGFNPFKYFPNNVGSRSYLTMTRQFPGGCIIKVRGNTADPRINKADLLEAIPQNLHSRDCISFVVDPTILVPIETDVYNLNTPLTHLAAFISKISSTEIKINEKTILSKIQDGFPNQISDAEDVGHGKI
jgi:hypothetical protein